MHNLSCRFLLRPFFLVGILLSSHFAFCWGVTGHRVIGEIAQQHLSKKTKKELRNLIGRESLAWWSNWADFIKSDSTWNHSSPWHYVDVPGHISRDSFFTAIKNLPGKTLYT
ncbi:MAG: S1/P1 nuclease, partial [Chitinophagaceae bacterium]